MNELQQYEWTTEQSERVKESYIAWTSEYVWYVTVIRHLFYVLNVTLKWFCSNKTIIINNI